MYQLIDSGNGQKLERFGEVFLIRPCASAVWSPSRPSEWRQAHARFTREKGHSWEFFKEVPKSWIVTLKGLCFEVKLTDFGHVGLFPEHAFFWSLLEGSCRLLNLFAYSGGTSLAAAKKAARVTHVDAARGMVEWAKKNASLNNIHSIQWIVDDVSKYLARAIRRQHRFDAIVLDPPSFGRGKSNQVFKIERDLPFLLKQCGELLSSTPRFVILSSHTPGFTPTVLKQLLLEQLGGTVESAEMLLNGPFDLPLGAYAIWKP